jgi:hypothetical protein
MRQKCPLAVQNKNTYQLTTPTNQKRKADIQIHSFQRLIQPHHHLREERLARPISSNSEIKSKKGFSKRRRVGGTFEEDVPGTHYAVQSLCTALVRRRSKTHSAVISRQTNLLSVSTINLSSSNRITKHFSKLKAVNQKIQSISTT